MEHIQPSEKPVLARSLMLDVIEDQCECHKEIEGGCDLWFCGDMPL